VDIDLVLRRPIEAARLIRPYPTFNAAVRSVGDFRGAIFLEPEPFTSKAPFAEVWRNLVHIEIPPDDEVSRISQTDLFLEHLR
jgi:hypothetical protein